MIEFGQSPRRKRPSLTPMIDVVFLLLVFFMLASRFGVTHTIDLATGQSGNAQYQGAPRLVEISSTQWSLNGQVYSHSDLIVALNGLMPTTDAIVVLRPRLPATVQDIATALSELKSNGISNVKLIEARDGF